MPNKTLIYIGVFLGSTLGGWLGTVLAGGNWASWQGILGSTLGGFLGIYVGFKVSQYLF